MLVLRVRRALREPERAQHREILDLTGEAGSPQSAFQRPRQIVVGPAAEGDDLVLVERKELVALAEEVELEGVGMRVDAIRAAVQEGGLDAGHVSAERAPPLHDGLVGRQVLREPGERSTRA
jgi:hypothetical protein